MQQSSEESPSPETSPSPRVTPTRTTTKGDSIERRQRARTPRLSGKEFRGIIRLGKEKNMTYKDLCNQIKQQMAKKKIRNRKQSGDDVWDDLISWTLAHKP